MTDNHIEKLDEFKEKRKKTFWAILEKTLPSKVLELNELLASEKFSLERIKNIHTPLPVDPLLASLDVGSDNKDAAVSGLEGLTNRFLQLKMLKMVVPPGGRVDTNQELLELFQIITAQHFELLQYIATLKAAIGYMMPKVEDGNNFGVAIQESVVTMLTNVQAGLPELGWMGTFCDKRASFTAQICREPHVDDLRYGLRNVDETAFRELVFILGHMRDSYIKIHDVITKNLEKITKPRTMNESVENMYAM